MDAVETPYVTPMSRTDIESLTSEDITKRQYDALLLRINERFNYVFHAAMHIMGRKIDWYDFDNEGGNEDSPGFFDPEEYAENILFTGKYDMGDQDFYGYFIPTAWLSEDFEDKLKAEFEQHKSAKEAKALKAKQDKQQRGPQAKNIHANIRSKLTPEELKHISFK